MSMTPFLIIFVALVAVGLIGTILVATSKENKAGNPEYDKKTKGNWSRLTVYYFVATIAFLTVVLLIINN